MRISAADFRFGKETPRRKANRRQWHFVNSKSEPFSLTRELEQLLKASGEASFAVVCSSVETPSWGSFLWFDRLRITKTLGDLSEVAVSQTDRRVELQLTESEIITFRDLLQANTDDRCFYVGAHDCIWIWANGVGP